MHAILTHIAERDEPSPTLVPKRQPDALEAFNEGEGRRETALSPLGARGQMLPDTAPNPL
jgi:hypothetical protein